MTEQDVAEVLERVRHITPNIAGKRVLITGSRGFLGRAFVKVFAAMGARVVAVDRYALANDMGAAKAERLPNVEQVDHDVTTPFPIHGRVDFILSLAAIASPVHYARRALDCFDVIVTGTRRMLELAETKNATLLLSSTSELYGDSGWGGGAMREHALGALDPWDVRGRAYDVPKLASEALASIFAERGSCDVRTVRYFNAYGPGLSRHDYRVMSKFAAAAIDGTPLQVHGSGEFPTRSFCYLTDAIVGTLLVLTSDERRPVNVGNPEEVSMRALAESFVLHGERITGNKLTVEIIDPPNAYKQQPRRRRPDVERIEALGFKPDVQLSAGVVRFLEWANKAYREEKTK